MKIFLTVMILALTTVGSRSTDVDVLFHTLSYLSEENEIPGVDLCMDEEMKTISPRGFGITSSILHLIYSLIGKTGHSPKSLELARQMNVSITARNFLATIHRNGPKINIPNGHDRETIHLQKLQEEIPESVPFPCQTNNTRSKLRPTRVNRVRPGDIDVIAALGDSLIAANGAVSTNVFQVLIANRGVSWAIGGQETWRKYLTLPNILKEFNPKLIGYSTGDSLYSANRERSQLNAAEPAARSKDLIGMAQTLIERIYAHPQINVQKDWKMVTIFIGAMDFCFDMCFRENPHDILEEHRKHLTETLNKLKENLPRTIVNVVLQINLGNILPKFTGLPWLCARLYKSYECPCLVDEKFRNLTSSFRSIMMRWQEIEEEVVNSHQFRSKNDFAVVVQPFLLDAEFPTTVTSDGPKTDIRYLSHDCFHPSQLGHAKAANALWNNILEPIGRKATNWNSTFMKLRCPTDEHPYIPVR